MRKRMINVKNIIKAQRLIIFKTTPVIFLFGNICDKLNRGLARMGTFVPEPRMPALAGYPRTADERGCLRPIRHNATERVGGGAGDFLGCGFCRDAVSEGESAWFRGWN